MIISRIFAIVIGRLADRDAKEVGQVDLFFVHLGGMHHFIYSYYTGREYDDGGREGKSE